jgi:hypothetical protein
MHRCAADNGADLWWRVGSRASASCFSTRSGHDTSSASKKHRYSPALCRIAWLYAYLRIQSHA